jgi:hypothetical protein
VLLGNQPSNNERRRGLAIGNPLGNQWEVSTDHKKNKNNEPFEIQTTMRNKYHKEKERHQAVSELTNQNIGKPLHTCQSTPPH